MADRIKPRRSKFLYIFGGIWMLVSVPFVLIGIHMIKTEQRYKAEGVTAEATITNKTMEESRDSDGATSRSYYLHYRFQTADGQTIEEKGGVSRDTWSNSKEGDNTTVLYLPSDPSTSRVSSESDWIGGILFTLFGAIATLIGAACVWWEIKKRRLARYLEKSGILAEATVVNVGPGNLSINNVPQWQLQYSFKDMNGQTRQGTSDYLSPENAQQYKVGDTGQVRYDMKNPETNLWVG